MKKTDLKGQEVNIGDWIATIPQGSRSVDVGKIVAFSKAGNPIYKKRSKGDSLAVGLITERGTDPLTNDFKQYKKPQFIKIEPTTKLAQDYDR